MELVAPGSPVTVTGSGLPERANIQYATPGLLPLLGVKPVIGRFFLEESDSTAIVLSYAFWKRRFGADSSAIGQRTVVNGEPRTVIGVLPAEFRLFDAETDLWMPISVPDATSMDRTMRSWLIAVGRLRPGVNARSAQSEMDIVAQRIAAAHPASNQNWNVKLEPIQEAQFGYWKDMLHLLLGTVLLVLLISCANIASLMLGRLATRTRELSIRVSLGATRAMLIRQLLSEGIAIGILGCVPGLIMAGWGIGFFVAMAPSYFPLLGAIRINIPVALFCVVSSLLCGSLLAIVPAILASRANLTETLRSAVKTTAGSSHARYRNVFAVAQISLSVALLVSAGLMLRSSLQLTRIDPGFRADHVLTAQMFLSGPRYLQIESAEVKIGEEVERFYSRLLERTQALPGVQFAAVVSWLPQMGYNTGRRERAFRIVGQEGQDRNADFNGVSSRYFEALHIPLLKGRYFSDKDNASAPWAAIVNQAFAQRYWPNQDPIGRELLTDGGVRERPRVVVGVVADVRQDSTEEAPQPEIYAPFLQQPPKASGHGYQNRVHMNIVLRISGGPDATVTALRRIAAEMDNSQPVFGVRTMAEVVSNSMGLRRLNTTLLTLFAAVALFLAAIGMYGVLSQTVSERSGEIGLRMALGASGWDACVLVAVQALRLTTAGMMIGIALSLALGRILSSYLFGVGPHDPATFVLVCSLLVAVSTASLWTPMRRAMRIDPIQTLRYE